MNIDQARSAIAVTQNTINAAIAELQSQMGEGIDIDVVPAFLATLDGNGGPGFEVVVRLRASR